MLFLNSSSITLWGYAVVELLAIPLIWVELGGELVMGLRSGSLTSMESVCVSASTTMEVRELEGLKEREFLGEFEFVR